MEPQAAFVKPLRMWGKRKELEKAFAEVRKYSKARLLYVDVV